MEKSKFIYTPVFYIFLIFIVLACEERKIQDLVLIDQTYTNNNTSGTEGLSEITLDDQVSYLIRLRLNPIPQKEIEQKNCWFGITLEVKTKKNTSYDLPIGVMGNGGLFIENSSLKNKNLLVKKGLEDGMIIEISFQKINEKTKVSMMVINNNDEVLEHIAKEVIIPDGKVKTKWVMGNIENNKRETTSYLKSYQLFRKK